MSEDVALGFGICSPRGTVAHFPPLQIDMLSNLVELNMIFPWFDGHHAKGV